MRALAQWAQWALCARLLSAAASLLPLEAEQLRASVGGFAVMNCHLDFPFGNEIPYHLQWDKDVSFLLFFNSLSTTAQRHCLLSSWHRVSSDTTLTYNTYLYVVRGITSRANCRQCGVVNCGYNYVVLKVLVTIIIIGS